MLTGLPSKDCLMRCMIYIHTAVNTCLGWFNSPVKSMPVLAVFKLKLSVSLSNKYACSPAFRVVFALLPPFLLVFVFVLWFLLLSARSHVFNRCHRGKSTGSSRVAENRLRCGLANCS